MAGLRPPEGHAQCPERAECCLSSVRNGVSGRTTAYRCEIQFNFSLRARPPTAGLAEALTLTSVRGRLLYPCSCPWRPRDSPGNLGSNRFNGDSWHSARESSVSAFRLREPRRGQTPASAAAGGCGILLLVPGAPNPIERRPSLPDGRRVARRTRFRNGRKVR